MNKQSARRQQQKLDKRAVIVRRSAILALALVAAIGWATMFLQN